MSGSLGAIALTDAQFAERNNPVSIYSLACLGNEDDLTRCRINVGVSESCGRFEDAGIVCQGRIGSNLCL